jgi:ATP-binding protein involved in chromosome partitioning
MKSQYLEIREDADGGAPTMIATPDSPLAQRYREIAIQMIQQLALQPKSVAGKFPDIVVE